jgi:hypothetical protein
MNDDCTIKGLKALIYLYVALFPSYVFIAINISVSIIVEITNTMHKLASLFYSNMLAPTCFGSSLPSSGRIIFLPYKTLTVVDKNCTTFKTLINLR